MPFKGLRASWEVRSDPDRIELYTRWTFYSFSWVEVLVSYTLLLQVGTGAGVTILLTLFTVHAVLLGVTCRQGLDWLLDRRPRPTAALGSHAGLTALIVLVLLWLFAAGSLPDVPALSSLVALAVGCGTMAVTLKMTPARISLLVALVSATIALAAVPAGVGPGRAFALFVTTGFVAAVAGYAGRVSCWILVAVRELDEARHVQARLAVAEERLRFARDLHDVLGRNLSVIALKSELAVQLAQRRERADGAALDQMVEVQRIARESQQELREVVRGYRDTGLLTELAGARGVLKAAGIDCEVDAGPDEDLPKEVRGALGWVVREGATNVLRHADASHCVIRLRMTERPRQAVLTITNDGVVPTRPLRRAESGSAGLTGLRERLSALGGTLSTSGQGDDSDDQSVERGTFVLTARLPVDTETDER